MRLIYLENILHSPLLRHYNMNQYLIKPHVNHNLKLVILKYNLLLYPNTSGHILQMKNQLHWYKQYCKGK